MVKDAHGQTQSNYSKSLKTTHNVEFSNVMMPPSLKLLNSLLPLSGLYFIFCHFSAAKECEEKRLCRVPYKVDGDSSCRSDNRCAHSFKI